MWLLLVAVALVVWLVRQTVVMGLGLALSATITVVAAGLLSWAAVAEVAWQWHERVYTAAIAPVTSGDSRVRCQRMIETMIDLDGNAGHVDGNADGSLGRVAHLDRDMCTRLSHLPDRAADASLSTVQALHVLAHEAEHVAGVRSESAADCYAIQHTAAVAVGLGISAAEGQAYAHRYLVEAYPHMPDNYRSTSGCRAGGELDLQLPGFVWPSG